MMMMMADYCPLSIFHSSSPKHGGRKREHGDTMTLEHKDGPGREKERERERDMGERAPGEGGGAERDKESQRE